MVEMVKCILAQSDLNREYWDELMLTAAYIRNRCKVETICCTPYGKLFGEKPDPIHMRMMGCSAFFKVEKPGSKLDPRGRKVIMIGYSDSNTQE